MIPLMVTAGSVLTVAAVLTLIRVVRGPTVLNRIVALEVLVSIMLGLLGLEAAYNKHTTTVPIMLAVALVGFVGSVSIASFVARDADSDQDEGGSPSTLGVEET